MLLKKLELIGFKSFADKTEFVYEPGITAIVGPNGCGKSNVVDAVKWILGEQSVKSLRGKEMSDVIFSGSGGRKSLPYAEATLTFDNADRRLGLDFDEVALTRRVYRSGEGAYFINKKPCRLKDIKNLLLDTGMGMQCYSVIEQGKIDQIIVTSTAERRKVFDEAAGISKYKARRKEAQAKLERVEQNLLRLNDIVEEVEKQLRSVKYQAAKARRYRQYTDELKTLRVSYSLREYDRFTKQSAEKSQRLRDREDERTRLGAQSDQADTERHECEMRALDLERSQESAQSALAEIRQAALAAEDAIRFNQTRIREQAELQEQFQRQKTSLEDRTVHMREEIASRRGQLNGLLRRLGEEQRMLEEKEQALSRMSGEEHDIADDLEHRKTEVVDLMQQTSRIENELGVILSEKRTLEIQRQRKAARINEVTAEMGANEGRIHQASEEIAAVESILNQLDDQTREKHTRQQELTGRLASMRDDLSDLRERQGSVESRLDVLREMDETQEGVEQGVREVLERFREHGGESNGLHGMLGENLTVEATYARAVEAALGHRAQTLVVEHLDHATEGVRLLAESGKGRASFLPLSHCKVKPNGHIPPEGVIGYLKEFVGCDERHRRVVECLLGDVLLVENLPRAVQLKEAGTNGSVLVTLAGEVIEPTGVITGGRGISGGGLISRAAERQTLVSDLDGVRAEMASLGERLRQSERSQSAIADEIQRLADLVEREKGTRNAKLTFIERLKEKQRMLGDERDILVSERSELERESTELGERERELRTRLDTVRREDEALESRIESLTTNHEQVSRRRAVVQDEMTELKVTLARSRQQIEGLRSAIDNLDANLRIRVDEIEQLSANITESKRKETESREEIGRRETEREALHVTEQQQQGVVLGLTNRREELRGEMTGLENTARELKHKLTEVDAELGDLRLEAQELKLKMDNLVERVQDEYQLDLATMYEGYQPEEMNWEEVATRIEELRQKVSNMGNVNLDAIDSEDELAERAAFLNGQRNDLMEAKRKLEDIIHRLNKQSLEMFTQSFAVVRENFQEMFRKLFGGGKADLFLEDEQDILESGIEIIARPPGKEPRSISLLSGGEKVMTAVALLFAIFKAKPSPFCILDEVDAALDEANIGRFANILQSFLKHSQFIIITHSKRTMAIANVIYGITMQETGVSKKISVKFEDYEQQVA